MTQYIEAQKSAAIRRDLCGKLQGVLLSAEDANILIERIAMCVDPRDTSIVEIIRFTPSPQERWKP